MKAANSKSPSRMMLSLAIQDIFKSAKQHRLWLHLGWVEVKQRYRRSVIGPWWISLSMLIFIAMMGIVFSRLFHQSLDEYIPFFTAGYLFWTFISSSINEASEIFRSNGGFIKHINLPFTVFVLKHLVRQTIYLGHNAVIFLLVCLFFKINPGFIFFIVLPGFLLLLLNVFWMSFIIAMVSTRFRDMVQIIASCVQVAFFITPISWMPKLLSQNSIILKFNPLVYLLDIVRSPLLGFLPSTTSFIVASWMAIGGTALAFIIFSKFRSRIAFWVD